MMNWSSLVEEHLGVVPGVVRRTHLSPLPCFDRDDMLGVGYLALVEAAPGYDPTRGASPFTYFYGKVRWALLAAYRAQFPLSHGRYDPAEKIRTTPIDMFEDDPRFAEGARDEYLGDLLALLTPREREIVRAVYWEGQTGTDVARRLAVEQTGVNRSLRAALAKLRGALAEPGPSPIPE